MLVIGLPQHLVRYPRNSFAGAVKDFFDRTFYPSQGKVTEKPCILFASGGGGGKPALESLKRICKSFKFKQIGEVTSAGKPSSGMINECEKLGEKLAKTVE